jgi:lipid-A-disaccharide synthase
MAQPTPHIFFSAGEASGDHYGAEILTALRSSIGNISAFGLGGVEMESAGLNRHVQAEDVAVMGITEVIHHMPRIYGAYRKLVNSIRRNPPDVAVLIDFPDVNLRLARVLHKQHVPVVYFVSPQLWAWKRRRIERVRRYVTKMLVIFPFEENFYRARGVDAEFVGHPLAELPLPSTDRLEYAQRNGLDPARHWIALLPGSRMREVRYNLPVMLQAAEQLSKQSPGRYEFLLPVASTLQPEVVRKTLQDLQHSAPNAPINLHLVDHARDALHFARASIVASGTATVQAAVIGNPFIAVYRVSAMTYLLARRLVRYPAEIPATRGASGNLPVAMVNLIAAGLHPGLRVVPELLQDQFTADNVVAHLLPLLAEGPARSQMQQDLLRVRAALLPIAANADMQSTSINRVCRTILSMLPRPNIITAP